MDTPRLEEVRLPLQDLTVLIGRNGSGKPSALDGLMALSRPAPGEPVRSGEAVLDPDAVIAVSPEARTLREELTAVEGAPHAGRRSRRRGLLARSTGSP
ncbi:hypothetical protein ACH5AO_07930 [Streptomyces sp. NPDC018964]|uniref:hypothetical protein n=1 Tax=Streptomyces sp. NPDC018964 TaxID=3365058 RepID=UPI0037A035B8